MMRCHSVLKKLSAYQDGELKPQEHNEARRHLLRCRSCRNRYEELEQTWKSLGELEEIRPDPWFYAQLSRKIKETGQKRSLPALQHVYQLFRTPAIGSILLVIGMVTGSYLGNMLARNDFFPFQPPQHDYSQETLLDSLKIFDPAPPGSLAHGYLQMVSYKENESR